MLNALRSAVVISLVTVGALAVAQTPPAAPPLPALAIQNVTLIPMDSERVLRDQTVIVEGRRITARWSFEPRPRPRKARSASKAAAAS